MYLIYAALPWWYSIIHCSFNGIGVIFSQFFLTLVQIYQIYFSFFLIKFCVILFCYRICSSSNPNLLTWFEDIICFLWDWIIKWVQSFCIIWENRLKKLRVLFNQKNVKNCKWKYHFSKKTWWTGYFNW